MEEDESKSAAAEAQEVFIPVNSPKYKNAAGGISSSSWLLAVLSCIVAAALAAGSNTV
jgi:hypothetical protein